MALAPSLPPQATWQALLDLALSEDVGAGDITSALVIPPGAEGRAQIEAREELVVCGMGLVREVFRCIEPRVSIDVRCDDGHIAGAGEPIAFFEGPLAGILTAERTALNFLGRLCGISSFTRRFVEEVAGTRTQVVDTRKTLPGWRVLDKYAVAVGGGTNHRFGLFDGILLKDNHIAVAGGVGAAVKAACAGAPANLKVQVEVESEADAEEACEAGADLLLIDNCEPDVCRRIVDRFGDRVPLEATGGLVLSNARLYAEAGVHRISIGALTHSAPAADVALEIATGGVAK